MFKGYFQCVPDSYLEKHIVKYVSYAYFPKCIIKCVCNIYIYTYVYTIYIISIIYIYILYIYAINKLFSDRCLLHC